MKKYPKIVQCDKRGQIVIPKDIRADLKIDEGTGFWVYSIADEGILLKKVDAAPFSENKKILEELDKKSDKLKIKKESIKKAENDYEKTKDGKLEII